MVPDSSGKAGVAILIKRTCPLWIKSTRLDPQGRYVTLECEFMSTTLTLMNVYTPNSGQIKFLPEVFEVLQQYSHPFTLVGGNFNVAFSPLRDRRSLFHTNLSPQMQALATSFWKWIRSHHLFDSWRIKHPTSKQFSFYSPPYKMFTWTGFFLCLGPYFE